MPHLRMKSRARSQTRSRTRSPPMAETRAPPHPFPELQGPFEESMSELERREEHEVPSDAASRRTILLDAPTYERVIAGRWKQRPGEKYHPLWKIVAQLSFGIHLLAENLAKSEEEVMQILQGHIDEIDLFLERTTEDFALAQDDVRERMRCLQLPLQHPKVFDRMLEDRAFRTSIVEGNEKIEHIVSRTGFAMKDSLKDAQKGLDATGALQQYLTSLEATWGRRSVEHEAVFEAMLENVEGWRSAFADLHDEGDKLGYLLKQLTDVINQMQQRAGEVSRKLIRAQQKQGHSPSNSKAVTYVTRQSTSTTGTRSDTPERLSRKPLPGAPARESVRQSAMTNSSQRCGTSQSGRSMASHRSGEAHTSRAPSREGVHTTARDSAQTRLSARSPRLIEIRRLSPTNQEVPQPPPSVVLPKELPRASSSASHPVELPAELSGAAIRTTSVSTTSLNAGLGIMHDGSQSQLGRQPLSPTSVKSGGISELAGSTVILPLTPSTMGSNRDADRASASELPCEPVIRHASAPALTIGKPPAEPSSSSPPSTPGWAKQTFDTAERARMVTDKTAFRSHPPTADLGSPPVMFQSRFSEPTQHGRFQGSIASSLGAPGPEVASSNYTEVVKSGNMEAPTAGLGQPSHTTADMTSPASTENKKTFVAELEGTTPMLLSSAVFSREEKPRVVREVINEIVELEAPQAVVKSSPKLHERSWLHLSISSTTEICDQLSNGTEDVASVPGSATSPGKMGSIENKMAAAIRRSFIATNIELPGSPLAMVAAGQQSGESVPKARGIEDILAQIEGLSSEPVNLSLKGYPENKGEVLLTLPATTYVATREQPSRPAAPLATQSTNTTTTTTPGSVSGGWSGSASLRSKVGLSKRNSTDSNASSQSQWRAFFKGQLSPAEFNSNTPNLASKVNSTHKAIADLQRRGQEASPTIGWQWAPESPEMDRRTANRAQS